MKKHLLLIICLLLGIHHIEAQQPKRKAASKVYNFSEAWVWEYKNVHGSGEFVVYRDPKTNYWLFTKEALGNSSEMTEWVIGKPNGEYIFAYQQAEMGSALTYETQRVPLRKVQRLPLHYKSSNKIRTYGDAITGFPLIKAKSYTVSYEATNDKSNIDLAKTSYNFAAIYNFNTMNIDAKLPLQFPTDIPTNYLAAYELVQYAGGSASYSFKYVSHTEYYIELGDYNGK